MNSLTRKLLAVVAVLSVLIVGGAAYLLASGTMLVPRTAQAAPSVGTQASPAALYSQDTVTSIFNSDSPAVVEINVTAQSSGFFGQGYSQDQGSGFLVDTSNGYIVTNEHVVDGATSVQVVFKDGSTANATVVATDKIDDLAVIKVDPSTVAGVKQLQFADSSQLVPGQMAIAIGAPYGLPETITVGVVSGLDRTISGSNYTGMIQTDAAINPGNSGGPLLDENGQVIGINTAIESAQGAQNIGFAIPSNVVKNRLPGLEAGTSATRPYLGITGTALTADLAKTLGLSVSKGVYVIDVTSGSPADKAGLKGSGMDANGNPVTGGDVITAVDGQAVASVPDLSNYFNTNKKPGDTVSLTVLRGGSTLTVSVALGTWPATLNQSGSVPNNQAPNMPWPFGGGGFNWQTPGQ